MKAFQPAAVMPRIRARGRAAALPDWLRDRVTTTPGRLALMAILVVAVALCFGIAASSAQRSWARAADAIRSQTEPRLLDAVHLYRALSSANATVTATFTTGGLEPAGRRARYIDDVQTASNQRVVRPRALPAGAWGRRGGASRLRELRLSCVVGDRAADPR